MSEIFEQVFLFCKTKTQDKEIFSKGGFINCQLHKDKDDEQITNRFKLFSQIVKSYNYFYGSGDNDIRILFCNEGGFIINKYNVGLVLKIEKDHKYFKVIQFNKYDDLITRSKLYSFLDNFKIILENYHITIVYKD